MSSTIVPPMKWAQRKESVFVTVNVTDMTDTKVDVNASHLTFTGKTEQAEYSVTLNFYKDINPEKSQWSCTPRCVQFHLKKDTDESWPQLLKNKNEYKNLLQIDWALWADSDDEDEDGRPAGNFELPPNFQELMRQYNPADIPMDGEDGCGCGCGDHDHCGCGDHDCHCEDHEDKFSESSDDDDEMPPLEEDN